MEANHDPSLREFVGFIWIAEQPGVRLNVWAHTVAEARAQVVADYGKGHVISLWNEDDAGKPRSTKNALAEHVEHENHSE